MNIVLVDDEPLALESIVDAVKKASPDSQLYPFGNPYEALEFFKSGERIDVVFLDVEMFGISGVVLAKNIKDIAPDVNIIFVTGYSEYAMDAINMRASGYLLKPAMVDDVRRELGNLRYHVSVSDSNKKAKIHTFGNFEVYADGVTVSFTREKSKEVLAYLVDRNGAGVTIREIAGVIWEDREFDRSLANQFQVIISALRKSLRDAGIDDIIIKSRNSISIDKSKVDCDYFRFLEGDAQAVNSYMGEYMTNYAWAEFTVGYLEQKAASTKKC